MWNSVFSSISPLYLPPILHILLSQDVSYIFCYFYFHLYPNSRNPQSQNKTLNYSNRFATPSMLKVQKRKAGADNQWLFLLITSSRTEIWSSGLDDLSSDESRETLTTMVWNTYSADDVTRFSLLKTKSQAFMIKFTSTSDWSIRDQP